VELTDTIDSAGRVETRERASAVIDGFDGMMLIAPPQKQPARGSCLLWLACVE
jgi:hypothetical protein